MNNDNTTQIMQHSVAADRADANDSPKAYHGRTLRTVWSRIVLAVFALATAFVLFNPVTAFADVTVGGETLHGWTPSEMAQTDVNVN